ncbi:hypothetical protein FRC18_004135 [Serendipita sp. 400]|nr:hypothetical protein FRC18_004135 [Serendipita sp. 400]
MTSQQPRQFRFSDCALYDRSGTNSRGNHWCSRMGPEGYSYHYNNLDGSAYARYGDGTAIYFSRWGSITFYLRGKVQRRIYIGKEGNVRTLWHERATSSQ